MIDAGWKRSRVPAHSKCMLTGDYPMTYRGHIENGTVVLEEPLDLPEGSQVECELRVVGVPEAERNPKAGWFYEEFKEFIGCVKGTPPDLSSRIDDYLEDPPGDDPAAR